MEVQLLANTPFPEEIVSAAAKGCYSSHPSAYEFDEAYPDGLAKYLNGVIKSGHLSVIEHAVFTFSIEGISRACSHQLVRHRIASYSQQSQRYVNFSPKDRSWRLDELSELFVLPPEIEKAGAELDFFDFCRKSLVGYEWMVSKLLKEGRTQEQANEDARYLLPNAARTNITVTMNARALFNFFNLRMCKRAQWEIRELATKMYDICYEVAPIIFAHTGANCMISSCKEGKHSCGVPYPHR
jgi:thymidylate synthase (FAD)